MSNAVGHTPKKCECAVCVFTAKVAAVQDKLSAEDAAVIESLLIKWEHEATDATYYRLKWQGKWPGDGEN